MPLKKGQNTKKIVPKDTEDATEAEQAVEKTIGALGAFKKQALSKGPSTISSIRNIQHIKVATSQVDSGSLLTNPAPLSPSSTPPPFLTTHEGDAEADKEKRVNEPKKEESDDEMKDPGGIEDVQQLEDAILVQLDLVPMDNHNMVAENIYATIQRKALKSGSTVEIQDLVANTTATPPMSTRALILYRPALVGDSKVAIGSVKDVVAGTAPLLAFKQLSRVTLEDKGGVYHTVLWYKPVQGEQPAPLAKVAPTLQPHQAQLRSISNSIQEPNHGFYQSKLNLEILKWLRAELDGPIEPLPRAGSLSDAWARERLYRKVKSNADKRFKYRQSYKINIGLYINTIFKVDALQDICFLRHTNCAKSTTGFAKAEKDLEMAQWLNEEARPGSTDFSSWSISKFWKEAHKRVEVANKKALALQEKKQMKRQTTKKSRRAVEQEDSEEEEMYSDD